MPDCQLNIHSLREKGYRITPQREMIIGVLTMSNHHMSAEDIFEELQTKTKAINVATIYRTLEIFFEEGLVSKTNLGAGHVVYSATQHGSHIHLVCRHCQLIIDADYPVIEPVSSRLIEKHNFKADINHISIFGLCEKCHSG